MDPRRQGQSLSFLPLGGIEDVTKNMYLYEFGDEILIVDCGLGFADETMLGVDLLLPDITYLLKTNKRIVGMLLTHGHEDHIGALPFLLPQLPEFPIFATPLTAALANEKLKEFHISRPVQRVNFGENEKKLGSFSFSFIHVTHSIPDTAHIFLKTPVGNIYHGSDFKFDLTPTDGKKTDFQSIAQFAKQGMLCLMSDCLGAERPGHTPSEATLSKSFLQEMQRCRGKFIMTMYSSNIARMNQVISIAEKLGIKVCFVGRSVIKAKEIGQELGYLQIKSGTEVPIEKLHKHKQNQLLLIVAGSQGQENSAMTRIANGEHRDVALTPDDVVIFSADAIPGNEISVHALIDSIAKRGSRVLYSDISDAIHVSGHGSADEITQLMSLVKPKYLVPISGMYRHMVAYKRLAKNFGYQDKNIFLIENGQELIFSQNKVSLGKKIETKNVYVDEISGEEVESFVLRDRERLGKEGIVIALIEIKAATGQLADRPDIIARGFSSADAKTIVSLLTQEIGKVLTRKKERVTNWVHLRKLIEQTANKQIDKALHRRPLVLPVIIEV